MLEGTVSVRVAPEDPMKLAFLRWAAPAALIAIFSAASCKEDSGPKWLCENSDEVGCAPDFSLLDHNPASQTYNTQVSPRDYLGMASAWYFGNST
jgi:hypothetical protein